MTSILSGINHHHILLTLFLLFCFGGIFFTYYRPSLSWISCSNVPVSTHDCSDKCLSALMENFTQTVNRPLITNPPVVEEKSEDPEPDILVLLWTWPFGFKFDVHGCSPVFGIKGCQITDDRSQYDKAHAVMFHHRDLGSDIPQLPNMLRPPHQYWVWMNMESPTHSGRNEILDDLFNLTSGYRRDSDIWVPYGKLVQVSEKDNAFQIPPKDKIVCWIVSHWNPNFRRVKFFDELSKHIKIEAYGRHFNRYVSDDDYSKILPNCKFYLSFENSIHKYYFTEKVFNPLTFGTVPVVLGPPRDNYEEFIPAHSFIHVDDFPSPKELAEYLIHLDQNQELYEQYFTWRKHFTITNMNFGLEHACLICEFIRENKGYRVFKNLNQWYFD